MLVISLWNPIYINKVRKSTLFLPKLQINQRIIAPLTMIFLITAPLSP